MSRQVATDVAGENKADEQRPAVPTSDDKPRQAATEILVSRVVAADNDPLSRYVSRLEDENVFLRKQVAVKDEQIGALLERDRETNFLIRELQRILAPGLGGPDQNRNTGNHDR